MCTTQGRLRRSSAFGSTPASVICWPTRTGTESRPTRPAATRCSGCSKQGHEATVHATGAVAIELEHAGPEN